MNGGITKITVFYDPECGVCRSFRLWLKSQSLWLTVDFIGYDTPEAEAAFPGIRGMNPGADVIVLADTGQWWQGADAWLTCLWATVEYRPWSFRLSAPIFRPVLMQVVHLISTNRMRISKLMQLRSDRQLASELSAEDTGCDASGHCGVNVWRNALRKGVES